MNTGVLQWKLDQGDGFLAAWVSTRLLRGLSATDETICANYMGDHGDFYIM